MRLFVAAVLFALVTAPLPANAAETRPPGAIATISAGDYNDNIDYSTTEPYPIYWNWASDNRYDVSRTSKGRLLMIKRTPTAVVASKFDMTNRVRFAYRKISIASPWTAAAVYGAPDDKIYVLTGRSNYSDSTTAYVMQVRKYDQDLNLLGTANIRGGIEGMGITNPFEATASSMTLVGTDLVVHTARLIFEEEGVHHQVNLTLNVDTATMRATNVENRPYASHSFRQFVRAQGTDAVFLDHGDGYPRGFQVARIKDYFTANHGQIYDGEWCMCWQDPDVTTYQPFKFKGSAGYNFTGATANGFEVGSTRVLTAGTALPHYKTVAGVTGWNSGWTSNVFVMSTDPTTGGTAFRWITTNDPRSKSVLVGQPQLTPLGNDRFALLFTRKSSAGYSMQYRLLDQSGNVLASKYWGGKKFTALSRPQFINNQILWVGHASSGHYLYGLNVTNPASPALLTK